LDFVHKALDDVMSNYNVDRTRIVAYGYQGGGVMAYLAAFAHRDLIRGVAAIDAALPARTPPPTNDPIHRLAFFAGKAEKSPHAPRIDAGVARLRKMGFPVTVKDLGAVSRRLLAEDLSELVRWIDTLDRI